MKLLQVTLLLCLAACSPTSSVPVEIVDETEDMKNTIADVATKDASRDSESSSEPDVAGDEDATVAEDAEVDLSRLTARDRHWIEEGYELYWVGTPSMDDVGGDVENFFRTKWNGDYDLRGYSEDPAAGTVSIDLAPDGEPSLKGEIFEGNNDFILHVYGHQFGPQGPEKQLVASMEWYNPCDGGQNSNGENGTYIGFGHVWGSADNVNTIPGGGSSADDAWSYRLALSTSNFYSGYAYIPDRNGATGRSFFTEQQPACDRWQILETEIIQNDVGESNAIIRIFIDGELAREEDSTMTRTQPTVRPKGHGVLIKHNGGPDADETYYLRNWKLFTK